jgi:hypothetical protein
VGFDRREGRVCLRDLALPLRKEVEVKGKSAALAVPEGSAALCLSKQIQGEGQLRLNWKRVGVVEACDSYCVVPRSA